MNIGIIGGTDGLGKTIITYLHDEFDVAISGRDHQKGEKVANMYDVDYYESNTELAENSDIVIVSVPINFTPSVIREVAPYMQEGSLLVDVTSVKEEPSKVMAESLPDTVDYIPTHPIFGPRTVNLDNQVIVLTPIEKGPWYEKVYNFLKSKNMEIIETTPEKHDEMMGIVQVLTHFSFICSASAMEKLKVKISETEDFESPIYNLMIDMIARIVSQNPYLTYFIQTMNPNGVKIRNTFADAVVELKETINNGDESTFVEIANRATKNMGDIQAALGRSDKAINALSHENIILNEKIGETVGLKHIYSGKVHIGILEKVTKDTIFLKKGNKTRKLKLSNIEVLSPEDLYEWKIDNYNHIVEDISCEFNKRVNLEIILETIKNIENIISFSIIDIYTGPQIQDDHISITFKITALYKEAIEKAKEILTGFGGVIR
ncbi:MAG: prephenate dehydrogenase [Methanobrevibacter sp.]|uniref:prephenate dehydrogenase n=1 Tax=Methanobrevibacter sp. TaxID=66852 RepID=UPI0026DF8591|nr:prephenate dehydrogenase [Methanobrevibacter sp.]MDO5848462.1 prephenate dehydrogenase [Methanobrevibacter sp.]